MAIRNSPDWVYCSGEVDSTEHTFFVCQRWAEAEIRLRWHCEKGESRRPEEVIPWMLETVNNWTEMVWSEDFLHS
ncbi:unnamed protein product [Arctia plantaginis]|uniref:Uncharacterized protein n=1 Tax=Arctia plantaginis TaxID=874455 RepID=A0A8S0YSZ2_ARCPL|nr:unnamed protein product [Arctia plantaginis]